MAGSKEEIVKLGQATQFSSTNQPINRGRPKKLENQLKDLFKNPELTDKEQKSLQKADKLLLECFLAKDTWLEVWVKMIEKTDEELEKIRDDKEYPIGFRMVAKAILKDFDDSQLGAMLTMFTRKYGLPHQPNIGVTVNMNKIDFHNSPITYEEAARAYEEELRNP
jgi:hypothetical protein